MSSNGSHNLSLLSIFILSIIYNLRGIFVGSAELLQQLRARVFGPLKPINAPLNFLLSVLIKCSISVVFS